MSANSNITTKPRYYSEIDFSTWWLAVALRGRHLRLIFLLIFLSFRDGSL